MTKSGTHAANSETDITNTGPVKTKRKRHNAALLNKKRRNLINAVNLAIREQKIFTISSQNPRAFPSIRSALKARGWLEKSVLEEIPIGIYSKTSETTMKMLRTQEVPAYFYWSVSSIDFGQIKNFITVNKFPKNIHFTTKVGLCTFLQDFHWFYDPDVSDTITPRTFNISNEGDILHFTQYYVLSACISLLKLIVDTVEKGESCDLFTNGQIPTDAIDFAVKRTDMYVSFREHNDIDTINVSATNNSDDSEFLSWFYEITHKNGSFYTMTHPIIHAFYSMSKTVLKSIAPFWELMNLEGMRNLWIIKPANSNCGKGVSVKNRLEEITENIRQKTVSSQHGRYVVQKYIECPLLIFNTKFDIRQWFLVTCAFPLCVWIYSDCYLRFSSQQFSLDNLHESVHLTNNSVQCNYINGERDEELPEENMWHCDSFKRYLNEKGLLSKWTDVIYPGMCKGIIGALLASQEEMVDRSKSFELYGADFMIGEDFTTILIEINAGPCMRYTTRVTEAMCKACLEDIIKVVVDRKDDPSADTGKFTILYKQEMGPKLCNYGMDFPIIGTKIKPSNKYRTKTSQLEELSLC